MKNKGLTPAPIDLFLGSYQLVRGFTLVEILISLLILGLGLIALFNIFPLGLQSITYSRKLNEVSIFAQKKLEEMKSQGQIEDGASSGKEGDLNWQVTASPLKFPEGFEVTFVELDVDFNFSGAVQKQRFVTYILGD